MYINFRQRFNIEPTSINFKNNSTNSLTDCKVGYHKCQTMTGGSPPLTRNHELLTTTCGNHKTSSCKTRDVVQREQNLVDAACCFLFENKKTINNFFQKEICIDSNCRLNSSIEEIKNANQYRDYKLPLACM